MNHVTYLSAVLFGIALLGAMLAAAIFFGNSSAVIMVVSGFVFGYACQVAEAIRFEHEVKGVRAPDALQTLAVTFWLLSAVFGLFAAINIVFLS